MRWLILLLLTVSLALAADPIRPDAKLTPGVINTQVTDVCSVKWGLDARHVTEAMKQRVFAAYGIPWSRHTEFEVDHLISRELGGADDTRNLWPQLWAGQYGARVKDRTENRLHELVCTGKLTIAQAQDAIRTDWIAAYHTYVR